MAAEAVTLNTSKAKQKLVRFRPILKFPQLLPKIKAKFIEIFVEPTANYGLSTIVLRLKVFLNTARGLILGLRYRSTMACEELAQQIPLEIP